MLFASSCAGEKAISSVPIGEHHHYVVDALALPATSGDATSTGVDLDGDGSVDNQFGMITAALAGAGFDLDAAVDEGIRRGETLLLADVQATSLTDASRVGFSFYEGTNVSPAPCTIQTNLSTCGQHLTGAGNFDVVAGSQPSAPVSGRITAGVFDGLGGDVQLTFSLFGTDVPLRLTGARAHMTAVTTSGFGMSTIAGIVSGADLRNALLPALISELMTVIDRDCISGPPTCGCAPGSSGEDAITLFDANADCAVTIAELESSALLSATLAPDMDIDGDGANDALSLGMGMTGVAATFAQP